MLQAYEDKTGGNVLAIAHNGNLSNGIMFPEVDSFTGKAITREYAQTRAKWEPLYEVTQMKGDGEAILSSRPPTSSPTYEKWDKFNLNMSVPKQNEHAAVRVRAVRSPTRAPAGSQARNQSLQVRDDRFDRYPYRPCDGGRRQFLRQARGDRAEPETHGASRWLLRQQLHPRLAQAASGYAGVWATENTREAIFDAMERRETYATTGPRMVVRFFGGWDFTESDATSRLPANAGYTKGVPMGGDLRSAPAGKAPTFLVAAMKDPMSGNLDRIQIIKGWSMPRVRVRRRSTTSPGPTIAGSARTASCRPSATRWMWRTRPGPTASAPLS